MTDSLIAFRDIPWKHPAPGVPKKVSSDGINRIRLIRFDDPFLEEGWCTKGHIGYVLEGEMTLKFDEEIRNFQAGAALGIKPGKAFRHKAVIQKGEFTKLVLFEPEE